MRRLSQREAKQLARGHVSAGGKAGPSSRVSPSHLSLSFQISGAVLSCDSPAAGPRPPALPCVRTALHAALSCGCGSPSSSYRARPVMQGLSVPVVWWPRFPVTARCASWGWSFPRCLRFSLSLEGAGFVSSRAAVVSSQSALPACPAGPWGAE